MAKEDKPHGGGAPADNITELTIAANQIGAGAGGNPYEMRNDLILADGKQRIRYENGITLPASAQALLNDAESKSRHSRKLGRNIQRASGQARPAQVEAHHIVAAKDERADRARRYLFNWGIGINDADNGVFLPRGAGASIPGQPNALNHRPLHTNKYYFVVTARLLTVSDEPQAEGRKALRSIKSELLAGTFPF